MLKFLDGNNGNGNMLRLWQLLEFFVLKKCQAIN